MSEQQVPVAWMQEMPTKGNETRSVRLTTVEALAREEWSNPIPLYTAPQRREWVGLTEEGIYGLYRRAGLEAYHSRDATVQYEYDRRINDFARAIEAKLKEKNCSDENK